MNKCQVLSKNFEWKLSSNILEKKESFDRRKYDDFHLSVSVSWCIGQNCSGNFCVTFSYTSQKWQLELNVGFWVFFLSDAVLMANWLHVILDKFLERYFIYACKARVTWRYKIILSSQTLFKHLELWVCGFFVAAARERVGFAHQVVIWEESFAPLFV